MISDSGKKQKESIVYCTECGEALEDFCFDKSANDLSKIKKRHENCVKKDRFKGDFCSRLFIAEPVDPEDLKD